MTRAAKFSVTVDLDANAAYVGMTNERIVRTVEVTNEIMVDLDEFGVVAGIEFLRIEAEIPFQRLIDDFHVHSDDVEKLRRLRPSIGGSLQTGADGVSAARSEMQRTNVLV